MKLLGISKLQNIYPHLSHDLSRMFTGIYSPTIHIVVTETLNFVSLKKFCTLLIYNLLIYRYIWLMVIKYCYCQITIKNTRCVCETQMPPIMANSKDGHGHKDKYLDTSVHLKYSCDIALALTVQKLLARLKSSKRWVKLKVMATG